ncbi:MAG: helix-turn-helix transcriptional regulator [Candidatus Gracilibacteria bacterium]|jgi:DNA-binding PadR family transcriptional regulator
MAFSKEILKGSIELIVLQTLDDLDEAYGYQLTSAIEKSSASIFQFQESTLYPLLYRLEEKGFLESEWKQKGEKKRRYYKLTREGKRVLQEETVQFKHFLKGMNKILRTEAHA